MKIDGDGAGLNRSLLKLKISRIDLPSFETFSVTVMKSQS